MKLIYRGHTYEYDPSTVRNNEGRGNYGATHRFQRPVQLIYRGNTYTVDPNAAPAKAPKPTTPYTLIYRGATYVVNGDEQRAAAPVAQPTQRTRIPNALTSQEVARVHHANILRNLQHRLEIARQKGDQQLVNLLESELRQVA